MVHDHTHDGHDHDHGHADPAGDPDDLKSRTRALQSLLLEKDLISMASINEVLELFETEVGPMNGARVVARAWSDPDFKSRLLEDANDALDGFDFGIGQQHLSVSRTRRRPTTRSSVRSVRVILGRFWGSHRRGTNRRSIDRGSSVNHGRFSPSSASISTTRSTSRSGTRVPRSGIWCCHSDRREPTASTRPN